MVIVLTGRRFDDHVRVDVAGNEIKLPVRAFCALIALAVARTESGSGCVAVDRLVVCRLRRALDDVMGAGTGKRLIQTGCSAEYRLDIDVDHIGIADCFYELVHIRKAFVTQSQADALRKHCRPVTLEDQQRKPPGNRAATRRKPARNRKETERKRKPR